MNGQICPRSSGDSIAKDRRTCYRAEAHPLPLIRASSLELQPQPEQPATKPGKGVIHPSRSEAITAFGGFGESPATVSRQRLQPAIYGVKKCRQMRPKLDHSLFFQSMISVYFNSDATRQPQIMQSLVSYRKFTSLIDHLSSAWLVPGRSRLDASLKLAFFTRYVITAGGDPHFDFGAPRDASTFFARLLDLNGSPPPIDD